MRSSTQTLIEAMAILARDIESGDGVANLVILESSERLKEQQATIEAQARVIEALQARAGPFKPVEKQECESPETK